MDLLFELIVECMIGIITDDAIDIMNDSDRTRHLSKGMRIFIVATALLIFAAVTFFLLFVGISNIIEGNLSLGIPFTVIGAVFVIYCVVRFLVTYKKKLKNNDVITRSCQKIRKKLQEEHTMKHTSFGKKMAGIIAATVLMMSLTAVSVSAENEELGRGDTVTDPNTIAREVDAQKWELVDPNSITDANATAGGGMKLMITFTEAIPEGFEVDINFTTESGITKTFTAQSQVIPMQTNYTCIPIRDIYDKLGLGGQTLTSVTFTGRSAGSIMRIEYMTGIVTTAGTPISDSGNDSNPATGVADLTFPLVVAGVCGAAAFISMKTRRTK